MARPIRGALAAAALLLVMAAPALAGGWASITPDAATGEPREDEPVVIGFTVLQHGETPAPWETPTVVALNASTGEVRSVVAESTGDDGHFSATLTFPQPGLWSWTVELADLESDAPMVALTVLTASGARPTIDSATWVAMLDRSAEDLRTELRGEYADRLGMLEDEAQSRRNEVVALRTRLDAMTAERDTLTARVSELESEPATGGLPALAVIALAVLAGAGGAFAIFFLARPSIPDRSAAAAPLPAVGYAPDRR